MSRPPKSSLPTRTQWCIKIPTALHQEYEAFFALEHNGRFSYDFRNKVVELLLGEAINCYKRRTSTADLSRVIDAFDIELFRGNINES